MSGNRLDPGADAAYAAMAAAGFGHYANAANRARAVTTVDQDTAGVVYARRQLEALARDPERDVVFVLEKGVAEAARDLVADYDRDSENDRELEHIGPDGAYEPEPSGPIGVGVVVACWPGQVYELSPDFPLLRILDEYMPLTHGQGRATRCEVHDSVCGLVRDGEPHSGIATGFAVAAGKRFIFVWRCCEACRSRLLDE